eukprot:Pompholyxophrys_punicea_v1_NODE_204_length_2775_cov_14.624265.p1 type:complete len:548 gc:universal NODE_204_length_2775_cov_14.624265:172-1815(+)
MADCADSSCSEDSEDNDAKEIPNWSSYFLIENEWIVKKIDGYYCSFCTLTHSVSKGGVWIRKPCRKKSAKKAIYRHKNSAGHKISISAKQVPKTIVQHEISLNEKVFTAMLKRFREIYWLCKEDIALMKYNSLLQLEEINGAYNEVGDVLSGGRSSYTSHQFLNQAVSVIANTVKILVHSKTEESDVIGFMLDETTDISITNQMISYYRIIENGERNVYFAGLNAVANGTATTLTATALKRLETDEVKLSKVVCFGSDGGSALLGKDNGLVTRLLSLNPLMLAFHYLCHREALACQHAASEIDYLNQIFFPMTEQLGRFYRDSFVRTRGLHEVEKEHGVSHIKVITSAFTRWLSHDNVTKAIATNLPQILEHLSSCNSDAVALGLFHQMSSFEYIGFLLTMRDILPLASKLSKIFQSQDCDLSSLQSVLPSFLEEISDQMDNGGPQYNTLTTCIENLQSKGINVRRSPGRNETWLASHREKYLANLRDQINNQFPNVPFLSSFYKIFNSHAFPEADNLAGYADMEMEIVAEHYSMHDLFNAQDALWE